MKRIILIVMLALLPFSLMAEENRFSQEQLDQMMAPVALYPDALLSQILMASTYPYEVKEAVIWSKEHPEELGEEAVNAIQDKEWDPSVASLVAFPQILDMMGKRPEWVSAMGEAFLAEPDNVMDTIQDLRAKAKMAGNLKSSKEQTVELQESDGTQTIIIEQADPEVVYVPVYNPTVVYGPWWHPGYLPYYYYPSYYHPAPGFFFGFTFGIVVGNALWGSFNWHHHDVAVNVLRYNVMNVHRKLPIAYRHASWKNVVRHYNPRILKPIKSSVRDIQRQNAQKVLQHKNIHLNREGVQVRKKIDPIYYEKAHKTYQNREYKQQKHAIESRKRDFGGSTRESRGTGGHSREGGHR